MQSARYLQIINISEVNHNWSGRSPWITRAGSPGRGDPMNYPHFENPAPSNFQAAVTFWQDYADELALLAELSVRVVRTKQQISKAIALGEQLLMHLHKALDNLEGVQLRADELAKNVRLAEAEHGQTGAEKSKPATKKKRA